MFYVESWSYYVVVEIFFYIWITLLSISGKFSAIILLYRHSNPFCHSMPLRIPKKLILHHLMASHKSLALLLLFLIDYSFVCLFFWSDWDFFQICLLAQSFFCLTKSVKALRFILHYLFLIFQFDFSSVSQKISKTIFSPMPFLALVFFCFVFE